MQHTSRRACIPRELVCILVEKQNLQLCCLFLLIARPSMEGDLMVPVTLAFTSHRLNEIFTVDPSHAFWRSPPMSRKACSSDTRRMITASPMVPVQHLTLTCITAGVPSPALTRCGPLRLEALPPCIGQLAEGMPSAQTPRICPCGQARQQSEQIHTKVELRRFTRNSKVAPGTRRRLSASWATETSSPSTLAALKRAHEISIWNHGAHSACTTADTTANHRSAAVTFNQSYQYRVPRRR